MNLQKFDLKVVPGYEEWLTEEIQKLSIIALKTQTLTCNACGEVLGTYIVEYGGDTFRLPGEEAYTFLKFIVRDDSAQPES